jgi:hypothetical protein
LQARTYLAVRTALGARARLLDFRYRLRSGVQHMALPGAVDDVHIKDDEREPVVTTSRATTSTQKAHVRATAQVARAASRIRILSGGQEAEHDLTEEILTAQKYIQRMDGWLHMRYTTKALATIFVVSAAAEVAAAHSKWVLDGASAKTQSLRSMQATIQAFSDCLVLLCIPGLKSVYGELTKLGMERVTITKKSKTLIVLLTRMSEVGTLLVFCYIVHLIAFLLHHALDCPDSWQITVADQGSVQNCPWLHTEATATEAWRAKIVLIVDTGLDIMSLAILVLLGPTWLLTLVFATTLVWHDISEVIESIKTLDPVAHNDSWTDRVEIQIRTLAKDTMARLSQGWGRTLSALLAKAACSLFGALIFYLLTDGTLLDQMEFILAIVILAVLMILLLLPFAITSTECDTLHMALNDKRLDDMGTHEQIHVLEIGLRQVNNNNGLGFTILDVVINNKVLGKIIVGLATVIPSVVAAMLAMRPEIGQEVEQGLSATVGACQLSTSQQNSIENAVTEMVGAYNASCRFNISF